MKTLSFNYLIFLVLSVALAGYGSERSEFEIANRSGLQNWTVRNASLFLGENGLKVLAEIDQPRPVLQIRDVSRRDSFTAKVSLKITNPGTVSIAWMESVDGKEPRRRSISKKLKPQDGYLDVTLPIAVKGQASDFEVQTPWGDSTIKNITFTGGGSEQDWVFTP
ncbi:MAG: hypothetical protein P1U89_04100 [Verrucomicrobiales bacterium]|nr:hypothetical protein [Verrucomicrobiales bacterium]